MPRHDLEIEIGRDGEVRVHVKGAKGKSCLEYAKMMEKMVGKIVSQQLTSEYYEPEEKAGINLHLKQKR